ncbi:salicylate 1-monooxygenase [Micromonospora musae]|uniref:Salicylate 1-monooxygenase n=1 Tax=Micromonospora musae TaxID=1894970 RepID=A0ABX9REH8_9ACTN|nr:FAD-dependent monooxygenase [Micromonospora musae]RKN22151.1 salicylate 1-monooxygenase [Micromonospora musae]
MSSPRVAVVGAGIGGLALAAALDAAGTAYEVFERADRLTEVGAGVQLSPNAVRPLHRLGLRPTLDSRAVRLAAAQIHGWSGRPVARTELGAACEVRFGAPYLGMHRADLRDALHARVDPTRLHLGRPLTRVDRDGEEVVLTFADGRTHRADVVVGADGLRSAVRAALVPDTPVFSGLGVFRGLVPMDRLPAGARAPVARMWLGPGRHFVCYPVSGGRALGFAAIAPLRRPPVESWSVTVDPAELVAAFDGWHAPVAAVAQAAREVRYWALWDREPLTALSVGRVTLLGDAAHPMLPFLAQGANQAVEDAVELASCLTGASRADAPDRLLRYQRQRMPRTTAVQSASRAQARHMHLADGPEQAARDVALRQAADLDARAWLYGYEPGGVAA